MKLAECIKRSGFILVLLFFLLQLESMYSYLHIIKNIEPQIQCKIGSPQKKSTYKLLQAVRSTKLRFFKREQDLEVQMTSRSRKTLIDARRPKDQEESDYPSLSNMDSDELLRQLNATMSDNSFFDDSDGEDEIDEETIRKAPQIDLDNPFELVLRRRKSTNSK